MPLLRLSSVQTKSPSRPRDRAREALISLSKRKSHYRLLRVVAVLFLVWLAPIPVFGQLYAGVLGGVSTLSGDARSIINYGSTAFSSYNPKNGGALEVVVGKHFSDYFSVQASYVWNRNRLTLAAANFNNGIEQGYQEGRSSSQQSLIGDLLVYFRGRNSRLRPYLSVGTGFAHFVSRQERLEQVVGSTLLPAQRFSSNAIALNVPVGMDIILGKDWAFRYTFSETISENPVSDRLTPPGQHSLKNFRNLFGFVRQF